jgi:hypothetical protein
MRRSQASPDQKHKKTHPADKRPATFNVADDMSAAPRTTDAALVVAVVLLGSITGWLALRRRPDSPHSHKEEPRDTVQNIRGDKAHPTPSVIASDASGARACQRPLRARAQASHLGHRGTRRAETGRGQCRGGAILAERHQQSRPARDLAAGPHGKSQWGWPVGSAPPQCRRPAAHRSPHPPNRTVDA